MKNKKIILTILIVILLGAAFFLFMNNSNKKNVSQKPVKIGSKDFTENLLVAEIYALALEGNGIPVERNLNISGTIIHNAITNNQIDLYPEYTGTGLLSILKENPITDPDKLYEAVKTKYKEKFNLTWLDYAPANDGQGLVIRTDIANKLNIKTISDLQKNAHNLRFASQGQFEQRKDGNKGLEKAYGKFNWKSSTVYDNSLKYSVLSNNQADVTPAYTTEGQLINKDKYTLLKDDKMFWPAYNIAPVVNSDVLNTNPDIAKILNKVSKLLDTDLITKLNASIDVDGNDYKTVAKEFYDSKKKEIHD